MRVILDCREEDMLKALRLATEPFEAKSWGYWNSSNPGVSFFIRKNKASVSVTASYND